MKYLVIALALLMMGCVNNDSTTNQAISQDTLSVSADSTIEDSIIHIEYSSLTNQQKDDVDAFWQLFSRAIMEHDTQIIIANTYFPFDGYAYDTINNSIDISQKQKFKKYCYKLFPTWSIDSLQTKGYEVEYNRNLHNDEIEFNVSVYFKDLYMDEQGDADSDIYIEHSVIWDFRKVKGKYYFIKFLEAG